MAGNVAFCEAADGTGGTAVATPAETAELAALLGVDPAALSRALTTESVAVRAAGGGAPIIASRALPPDAARARLAALVAALYAALFAWLVRAANGALREAAAMEAAAGENGGGGGGGGGGGAPASSLTLVDGGGLEGAAASAAGGGAVAEWDLDTAAHASALAAHALGDIRRRARGERQCGEDPRINSPVAGNVRRNRRAFAADASGRVGTHQRPDARW